MEEQTSTIPATMTEDEAFQQLLEGVNRRDPSAAVELVRLVSPPLQKTVRHRLARWRLQNLLDPEDICQAVLAELFLRLGRGDLKVEQQAQLNGFLAKLARYRVLDEVRKSMAARRGSGDRASTNLDDALASVAAKTGTPSGEARANDLVATVYERLSASERAIAELRARGDDWVDIAASTGSTPEAVRKKLTRALDRIMAELKLTDE